MKPNKLHAFNTLERAAAWLSEETGNAWQPHDLLETEHGLKLYVWVQIPHDDPRPFPHEMRDGVEAPVVFNKDLKRLGFTGRGELMMTKVADKYYHFTPGYQFSLEDVRIARDDLRQLVQRKPPVMKKATVKQQPWEDEARAIAAELYAKDKANGCHGDSLDGYADQVETIMHKRGIVGPSGAPPSKGTIKRMALQGDRWWRNRGQKKT